MTAASTLGGAVREVRPRTLEEAREAMAQAAREGARVLFVGGGTELELGAPPSAVDLRFRTDGLDRVVEHAPLDQIVIVEAGVRLGVLQAQLATKGQMLALDPPWPDRATIGGVVATNAFGPRRTRYGSVRDLIIGISIVRADGTAARGGGKVVKNVAGFDLPKLMVGSLGTLALITTVTFRLHPLPEGSTTLLFRDLDAQAVRKLRLAIRQAQLEPGAVAALVREGGADLGVRFDAHFELGVRFEGFLSGVKQQAGRLLELAQAEGWALEQLDEAAARDFWARHDWAREASASFRAKLAARPSDVERMVNGVLASLFPVLEQPRAVYYPTLGLGLVAGDSQAGASVAKAISAAREALREGTVTIQAAPASVRQAVEMWGPPPPALSLMNSVKERLDPARRLAPGRFVGGI
jgi:glycolate oxidase FAD binding subunit